MADSNRDLMWAKLKVTYPSNTLADAEGLFWVSKGYEPCGPGDKCTWYISQGAGATGLLHYGDVENYYWTNIAGAVAPTFAVAGAAAESSFPTTTVAVPLTAGHSGKYGVIVLYGNATATVASTPAGWTLITSNSWGAGSKAIAVFGKVLDGTEGATVTVTTVGGQTAIGSSVIYAGAASATEARAVQQSAGAAAHNPTDITLAATRVGLSIVGTDAGNAAAITGGQPYIERQDVTGSLGFRHSIHVSEYTTGGAGATTDPGTVTWDTTSGQALCAAVQLNP